MSKRPINVLLVDDSSMTARVVSKMLDRSDDKEQYTVKWEKTLNQGLIRLSTGKVDIILLGLMLSDSYGMDTFTTANEYASHLPIIILSGNEDDEFAMRAVQNGAQDYIFKSSWDEMLIKRAIRYAIERKSIENKLRETTEALERQKRETESMNQELEKAVERANKLLFEATADKNEEAGEDQNIRILLVEDSPINRKIALKMLTKAGYHADVANDGKEAVSLLEKQEYDIVLMDVFMPIMDGLEATRIVRDPDSKVLNHKVPIFAMTANSSDKDRKRCFDAGMDEFLTKPMRVNDIKSAIEKQIYSAAKV